MSSRTACSQSCKSGRYFRLGQTSECACDLKICPICAVGGALFSRLRSGERFKQ